MMKLTKYEKETIILFNEAEDTASIYTYNAGLKKRLAAFIRKYPDLCRLEKSNDLGGTARNADEKPASTPDRTASTASRNNVAFRVDLRSECRVCTRCFDRNYIR